MLIHLSKSLLVLSTLSFLTACGGAASSPDEAPVVDKTPPKEVSTAKLDSLVRTAQVTNEQCPNGGIEIKMGIDANANGKLDSAEIDETRTKTVCHGSNGEAGTDGSNGTSGKDGTNGTNGLSSLISITEATVEECAKGGKKVLIGIDSNKNNILDEAEISDTELMCNIVVDAAPAIGSLITTTAEAPGNNCATGGVRIESGLDVNGNKILESKEIQATSYVCAGVNGDSGKDGDKGKDGETNLDNLLIDTVDEPFGSNCLHGGDKHRVGLDKNKDGVLQESEVISSTYSCNPNKAPGINFFGSYKSVAGSKYSLTIETHDYDEFTKKNEELALTIIEKPSWLKYVGNRKNEIRLEGITEGNVGDTFTLKASSTDTDLTTEKEYVVTIVDGIHVSVKAESVIEGNLTAEKTPSETPAEFVISLSKAANHVLHLNYQMVSDLSAIGEDWKTDRPNGVLTFEAGETQKKLPLTVLGDTEPELDESLTLALNMQTYAGDEHITVQDRQILIIENDDPEKQVVLRAGQDNSVVVMSAPINFVRTIKFSNHPEWIGHAQQHKNTCHPTSGCKTLFTWSVTGKPPLSAIGTTARFDVEVETHIGRKIPATLTYIVTETDKDNDGIVDSLDKFPENPRGQTDLDKDGLGDEWEMANFDSLSLANASTDFDNDGKADKEAFENNTPINDINFDFESGKLPAGWKNTGTVDWVVSDKLSQSGQYALTIDHALAPNETARIEFEINNQKSDLRLYARAAEEVRNAGLELRNHVGSVQGIYASTNHWNSYNQNFNPGKNKLALVYSNHSSTHNAPIVYIDNITGLIGMIPADRDGDGVLNKDDLYPDRADAATDTDKDGIGDEWEQRFFGTLDRVSATSDFDKDGLLDVNEFIQKANPTSSDSDNDGIADSKDAFPSDRKYQKDTDNDGLADKWELAHFASLDASDGSQDSDGDSKSDLEEFKAGTPPTPDSDGDGVADKVDAFPDNKLYQKDLDKDGLADKWEYKYGHVNFFIADGDNDQDGRTNLQEFLGKTNPTKKNLNALEDIYAVVKGKSITFNPTENDVATEGKDQDSIKVVSFKPQTEDQKKFGSLQDNKNGTYQYTAESTRLGWVRLKYTANDGVSDSEGEVFIHIVDQAPAKVLKIDGADSSSHSMALFDDGNLYAWGQNGQGQLGLGTTINNYVPTRIGGLPEIQDFVLGNNSSLALAKDGTVWKWGDGQKVPKQMVAFPSSAPGSSTPPSNLIVNIKAIAAEDCCSSSEYYLLKQDGTVLKNTSLIPGLNNIKNIKAGRDHLLALDESGIVWAYGSNSSGQLGYGQDTSSVSSPVKVSKITKIVSIEAGNNQSFAIDEDGQLFAWGYNGYGRLGDATEINRNVPVLVESLSDVAEVAAGYRHTLVRNNAGELHGMGYGHYGALGEIGKQKGNVLTPIKVSDEKIISIGAGFERSFFITESNLSYSFGRNTNGQLGDGTTNEHAEPAEISWLLDGVISELDKEGFEWGRIPPYWRNSGNNWQVIDKTLPSDVNAGGFAVKVRERLTDNASASLGVQVATGKGDVSFSIKTSTETEFDKLVFYIDGTEKASFSGENDWAASAKFEVPAGVHSFEWIYHKDGGTSKGEDTVWIDDILLPIVATP